MKTKEQASALADAMLAPAEAARQRKVEARLSGLYQMYPGLRDLSGGEPQPVLDEAGRYARRQWVLYVPIAAMLAYLAYILTSGAPARLTILAPTLGIVVTALIKRRLMRTYIKDAAGRLRSGGFDQGSTPRA